MLNWNTFTSGPLHWRVRTDWQDRLFDGDVLRMAAWRGAQALSVVKHTASRTIYRIRLASDAIYLKHYPVHDLRAYLRQRLRPAKARTELECGLALANRQVPTVEPIACGETDHGESYLITRAVHNAQRLDEFIQSAIAVRTPDEAWRLRRQLSRRLAGFVADLHRAGVVQEDMHTGNLLIQPDTLDLFLIDLHAVRLQGPPDWPTTRANLALVNRWLFGRSTRSERRRFWLTYIAGRQDLGWDSAAERRHGRELEQVSLSETRTFWRRRERRSVHASRHFQRICVCQGKAWKVGDLPEELTRALLADPDHVFAAPAARLLKQGRSATVAEFDLLLHGVRRTLIWKRFQPRKWSAPWMHLVRPTPALRNWMHGHTVRDRGLPTPRPLLALERSRYGLPQASYLLMEKVADACSLHEYVAGLSGLPAASARQSLRPMIDRLATLVQGLHDRGLAQRDLKAHNLLVVQGDGLAAMDPLIDLPFRAAPQVYMIDLSGLEHWQSVPQRRRIQNLARLNASFLGNPLVTRTDKLRFLRVYLRWGVLGKQGWKGWWRGIAKATQRKITQNQRRGRVLA